MPHRIRILIIWELLLPVSEFVSIAVLLIQPPCNVTLILPGKTHDIPNITTIKFHNVTPQWTQVWSIDSPSSLQGHQLEKMQSLLIRLSIVRTSSCTCKTHTYKKKKTILEGAPWKIPKHKWSFVITNQHIWSITNYPVLQHQTNQVLQHQTNQPKLNEQYVETSTGVKNCRIEVRETKHYE